MIGNVIADYADFMPVVLVLLLDLIFEHACEQEKLQEQEKERNQTCHIARAAEDFPRLKTPKRSGGGMADTYV
jgi:hypothetical protein